MKKIIVLLVFIICLSGCSKDTNLKKENIVAVTIVPQKTFVEAVCGDLMDTIVMIPPGNSPENYEPTPMQMSEFNKALIYFTIGVPAENASLLKRAEEINDLDIVHLENEVSKVYDNRIFKTGSRDQHIWLSPKRVIVMIETIRDELIQIDKDNKDVYIKNANNYIDKLNKLDSDINKIFSDIDNKKFIAFHPAFGYIAEDYGLEMYSLQEEGKEATPKHLKDMIDLAKKENIKVIFYQDEIDSKQCEAFAEELEGKTVELSPLSEDYINNLYKMANTMKEVMK